MEDQKNNIVIAPWYPYSDMGLVSFENSISEPVNRREAERLVAAFSGLVIVCPDEETAQSEVARVRPGFTLECFNALKAAAEESANPWFEWRNAPDDAGFGQAGEAPQALGGGPQDVPSAPDEAPTLDGEDPADLSTVVSPVEESPAPRASRKKV